ncbi:tyrosine protein phosphatase [Evansella sp. AB-P1]|uniref:tyrosine-protein phosphatase n=1 Tax=Evansella sp. AB-P1 TaxID=3037653 RepID=UPI00241EE073|nr:CpsB/CapC family capsule biosynthesis tyrosine phosphatase [Evansella sp. AB-P1]MDG5789295.1 tyrosine protein phosphatase [Evansella sp. AB-P1]
MIDLHCHILPNVDDGSQSVEDTLNMATVAVEEGITTIVATPHHKNGRYENNKATIETRVNEVNKLLKKNNIDVNVLVGQECRLYGEVLQDYEAGKIATLANSNYLFIEFPSNHVPKYTKDLFYDIQLSGLTPIIVHPERNSELMERPEKLYEFVKNGALTQITAGSVIGGFGKKIKSFTEEIIEANLSHFLASDAHNTTNRTFHLKAAYDTIHQEYGEAMVYFYSENAELVLENNHVMVEQPSTIKRRKKLFGIF